jgi:hypothetical protein
MPSGSRKGEGEIKRDKTSTLTTIVLLNASKATGMQFNECLLLRRLLPRCGASAGERAEGDIKLN